MTDSMKKAAEAATELEHPCRETCSGWRQGYERGKAETIAHLEKAAPEFDETALGFSDDLPAGLILKSKGSIIGDAKIVQRLDPKTPHAYAVEHLEKTEWMSLEQIQYWFVLEDGSQIKMPHYERVAGARWQFDQDRARIGLAEQAMRDNESAFELLDKANDQQREKIKELEAALAEARAGCLQKAKAENDERFQLEVGHLRAENAELREALEECAKDHKLGESSLSEWKRCQEVALAVLAKFKREEKPVGDE